MKVLVTAEQVRGYAERRPTLFLFDGGVSEIAPYQPELDAVDLAGKGKDTFRPFGLTQDDFYIYVASNSQIGKFSKADYSFCGLVQTAVCFLNTHEIHWHKDALYVTNTANDSIGICTKERTKFFSFKTGAYPALVPVPVNVYSHDTMHINSIEATDNAVYVVAHSDTKASSAIYTLDPNTWKIRTKMALGKFCHGVRRAEEYLYTLSTGTGQLMEYSIDSGLHGYHIVDPNKGFLRGLRYHNGLLYFVVSENLKTQEKHGCFLHVFDVKTKTTIHKYDLSPIEIVTDVLILEE